jgi:hypothetical protein
MASAILVVGRYSACGVEHLRKVPWFAVVVEVFVAFVADYALVVGAVWYVLSPFAILIVGSAACVYWLGGGGC